jgi:hypothetical protein
MLKFINFQNFIFLPLVIISISFFLNGCFFFENVERRVSDENFIMLENVLSPNGKNRILIYQYDNGGFGYGRAFWAAVPSDFQNLNLVEYELPDGYKTEGWTSENELKISKWKPYYYIEKEVDIKTGDVFKGIKVKLVENTEDNREKK